MVTIPILKTMEKKKSVAAATNEKVSTTYISDDIAFSILSKLPFKSLKRFECVRKSWSILSENHHFMNMFRNDFVSNLHSCSYYNGASLILRVFENHKEVFYSLSGERFENNIKLDWSNSFQNHFNFRIFGSINGALCLHDYYDDNGKIELWNPATQTIKLLPPSLAPSLVEESILDDDDDDDKDSDDIFYYVHGFGYDHVINDYKVIRNVRFAHTYLEPLWEICSLRSNLWRELEVDMPYSLECIEGTQVYMDGVCHWLCEEDSPSGSCLVSFYLSNEVFITTLLPSEVEDWFSDLALWLNLVVLNGSIALISYHEDTTTFQISILGEIGMKESWTKLLTVGPLPCVERFIGVGTKGEIFFIRKDKELVWLDLSTQMIEELGYKVNSPYCSIIIYKENILPLGEIDN